MDSKKELEGPVTDAIKCPCLTFFAFNVAGWMKTDLPLKLKKDHWIGKAFQGAGAAASIVALFKLQEFVPNEFAGSVYAIFVVVLACLLIGYVIFLQRRKLHRYADIPPYVHFVNHVVRDTVSWARVRVRENKFGQDDLDEIESATTSILDAISACFSILTGTQCGVCVKEFAVGETPGPHLRVAFRDSLSRKTRGQPDGNRPPHPIEIDTPCDAIFFGRQACHRSYCCNDVVSRWKENGYQSPSFEVYGGRPETFTLLGQKFLKDWKLHYRSALTSPIRFIRHRVNTANLPFPNDSKNRTCRYWGFLCVDAKKRHVFDHQRHGDVIATFADCLFIYFNELYDLIDQHTSPARHVT